MMFRNQQFSAGRQKLRAQPVVSERPALTCSPPVSYMAMANSNLPLLRKVQESELQKKAMDVDSKCNVSICTIILVQKYSGLIVYCLIFEYGTISDIYPAAEPRYLFHIHRTRLDPFPKKKIDCVVGAALGGF